MSQTVRADQTAGYLITVQGVVGVDWADHLGGLEISTNKATGQPTTTLSGRLIDQAVLLGVLNNLFNLGFHILTVECQFDSNKEKNYVRQ